MTVIIQLGGKDDDDEQPPERPGVHEPIFARPKTMVGINGYGQVCTLHTYDELHAMIDAGDLHERMEVIRILDDGRPTRMSIERWQIGPILEMARLPEDPPPTGA